MATVTMCDRCKKPIKGENANRQTHILEWAEGGFMMSLALRPYADWPPTEKKGVPDLCTRCMNALLSHALRLSLTKETRNDEYNEL